MIVDFLIRVLATWRISNMLVSEEGPVALFIRLRRLVGVRVDEKGRSYVVGEEGAVLQPEIGKAMTCIWCLSPWVGLVVALLPANWLLPFALSAGALLVNKKVNDG